MSTKKILVTEPSLPDLDKFNLKLSQLWESKIITNSGPFQQKLETKLSEFLGVKNISLVSNGTLAIMLAIKTLEKKGEIITTPFSYVATASSIEWMGCKPVFCDISLKDYNIDPDKIEKLITPKTIAILPVHVFGFPCNNEKISRIAKKYNIPVIYDAAHAFNVRWKKKSILSYGDFSTLSFHATKSFNTIEGGAVICNIKNSKKDIDLYRNFGHDTDYTVIKSGINSKLNELQSAFGLLQLENYPKQLEKRKKIFDNYISSLSGIKGIILPKIADELSYNYTYFPIRISDEFKMNRDSFLTYLNSKNIFPRKYFYPLITEMKPFKNLQSSTVDNLKNSIIISNQIMCLPIYENLNEDDQNYIIKTIINCL